MLTALTNSTILLTSLLAIAAPEHRFEGHCMGTTWHVTITDGDPDGLQTEIEEKLNRVDQLMSTWRDDSEVSRFNAQQTTDWFEVSAETHAVVRKASDIQSQSGGAFDITVAPLVDLWNFDKNVDRMSLPTDEQIAKAREHLGGFEVDEADSYRLRKLDPRTTINLSAIAKGFAVDLVAEQVSKHSENYLAEVGGEIRAAGLSPSGKLWTVGVEKPVDYARELYTPVPISNRAMATSGDYRNFYMIDGKRYSHTIDPRTGRPVEHDLASVSVLADTCMEADAWATAISVLGPAEGARFAKVNGIDCLLLTRAASGFEATVVGNFPAPTQPDTADATEPTPVETSKWPVFIAALVIFLVALAGMAIGVIISNKRLKGSCGGIAGLKGPAGQTACDLCAMPSPECRGERAESNPLPASAESDRA